MWILLILFVTIVSASEKEFGNIISEGEQYRQDSTSVKHIVPGYLPQGFSETEDIQFPYKEDNELFIIFNSYVEKGVTKKDRSYNSHNDEFVNATIALYRILKHTLQNDEANYDKLKKWAEKHVNKDMLDFALRLVPLPDTTAPDEILLPPYLIEAN